MEVDQRPDEVALDIEAYAGNYAGHAKVDRLLFIASKSAGTQLELDALKLAVDELKMGVNTAKYIKVIETVSGRLGPNYQLDRSWVDATDRQASQTQERLESQLGGYKTNLIKESIRMGYHELAEHHYRRGDIPQALKNYVRTRDYCTTSGHMVAMCRAVVRCALEMGNHVHVQNYVAKAEQLPDLGKDPAVAAAFRATAGLSALDGKKYKLAAKKFTEVSSELGDAFCDVVAAGDVALYGGLTALATLDRADLKRSVIDNIQFRELLELNHEVREMVYDFYESRYAGCLARLQQRLALFRLDPHLAPHVDALYKMVRSKALVQYTVPFVTVSLPTMAAALATDVAALERELAELIVAGHVKARIDSHAKCLHARQADPRAATFAAALKSGDAYLRDTRALLLRSSFLQHDLVQRHRDVPMRGLVPPLQR